MATRILQTLRPTRSVSNSLRVLANADTTTACAPLSRSCIAAARRPMTSYNRKPVPRQPARQVSTAKTAAPAAAAAAAAAATTTTTTTTTTSPKPPTTSAPPAAEPVSSTPPSSGEPLPLVNNNGENGVDWGNSFHGLSTTPFAADTAAVLMRPVEFDDVEVKPDGIIYLPEIKYRRILNAAFGPGGWGLAPRGELQVGEKVVTREYALVVHGRFIAQARGECQYFGDDSIPAAGEGCKSNALMRCCKDLGIASELWDPRFIREFRKKYMREVWVEHVVNKKKRKIWLRKDCEPQYPYAISKM